MAHFPEAGVLSVARPVLAWAGRCLSPERDFGWLSATRIAIAAIAAFLHPPGVMAGESATGEALYREGAALASAASTAEEMAIAIRRLETAAAFGSSRSLVALGNLYARGGPVALDELKAKAYYEVAALGGNQREAWRGIGGLLRSSEGVLHDAVEALAYYEKAAALGDGESSAVLAEMYASGEGVTADESTALHYFTQAIEFDANPRTVLPRLARLYRSPEGTLHDAAEALKLFEQSAALGHARSLIELGEMHARGEGTAASEERAARHFTDASAAGLEMEASRRLADLYRSPDGDLHDLSEAVRLYERAASLGDARASLDLGDMAAVGEGMPADEQKARQSYEQAAAGGLEREASRDLAALYLSPEGGLHDPAEAIRLYQRSAGLGDALSLVRLGDCYAEGKGVAADEAKAKEYYDRAGSAGLLKERAARLARMYLSAEGALHDVNMAAAFFEEAAALGDIRSVISLGGLFADGNGVERDELKAKELFEVAAARGEKAEATRRIAELYRSPEGALNDIRVAVSGFELAVSMGDVPSMLALGEMYASGEASGIDLDQAGSAEGTN